MICNLCNKVDCIIKRDFNRIIQAWIDGRSHSDIYRMILDWISIILQDSKLLTDNCIITDIQDIYNRMRNGDETNDIVEDFIYGNIYERLRSKYK